MHLVKALRRGFRTLAAAASVAAAGAACVDERAVNAPLAASDCPLTLRLPVAPRIVEVLDDGSLQRGPACGTANCLAGVAEAWAYRNAAESHLFIGSGAAALSLTVPARTSLLAAQHTLTGFVLGRGMAGIDRGNELEIITSARSLRLPMPELARGETLRFLSAVGDGLVGAVLRPGDRTRWVILVAPQPQRPAKMAKPIVDDDEALVGWLIPATAGTAASIVTASGVTLMLAPSLAAASDASATGGCYVVHGDCGQAWLVSASGQTLAALPDNALVEGFQGKLYVVDVTLPGAVLVLGASGLVPMFPRAERRDLVGVLLPRGAHVERLEAVAHGGRVLAVERVRTSSCDVEDRLLFIDLLQQQARTLASTDAVRLHPTFAGDRFRFVEADVSLETP